MKTTTQALKAAAGAFERISDRTAGERGRRATVVALVLRSVQRGLEVPDEGEFLGRRAGAEIEQIQNRSERALMKRLLRAAFEGTPADVVELLRGYAAGLEEARRLEEADAVMRLARAVMPTRPDLALSAGRIARLLGDFERALGLYREARELDSEDGSIARLAAIGEAVVTPHSQQHLARALRAAVVAGDAEASGVALEERARLRRAAGDRSGAARDLACAAARYSDAVDRARVGHELADLFVGAGDAAAAREALLFALDVGDASQQEHARSRLHTVARDMGDQLGARRWRSTRPPALVSLSSRPAARPVRTVAPEVARWRERIESLSAARPA